MLGGCAFREEVLAEFFEAAPRMSQKFALFHVDAVLNPASCRATKGVRSVLQGGAEPVRAGSRKGGRSDNYFIIHADDAYMYTLGAKACKTSILD